MSNDICDWDILCPVVVRYAIFQDTPGNFYISNVLHIRDGETPEETLRRLWSREFIELLKVAEKSSNKGEKLLRKIDTSGCWCNNIRAMITFDNSDYIEYFVGYLYERLKKKED